MSDRQQPDCSDVPEARLVLGVAGRGSLRWAAVDLADQLDGVRARADLSPMATIGLGRTLAAAALLHRFTLKNPGRILVEVAGDGPMGRIVAEIPKTLTNHPIEKIEKIVKDELDAT